jgi:UDP-N-acetylglucosamine transferase subunit ALG13
VIFVTVGTNEAGFDRLLQAVERLPRRDLVVQCGHGRHRPQNARCVEFMPFAALVEHIRDAQGVITHAGAGSVMVALGQGRTPIVVPRLHRFGEAVDDHQLDFARRLAAKGLVVLVEDPERLVDVPLSSEPISMQLEDSALADELRTYLDDVVGQRPSSASRRRRSRLRAADRNR